MQESNNQKESVWVKPEIGNMKPTKWGWVVNHPENLQLGKNTDIGFGTYIDATEGVEIGNDCQIGSHCSIYSHNTIKKRYSGKVIIEKGAQIGSFSLIMPGVTVHAGEIIRAYSYVDKDVGLPFELKIMDQIGGSIAFAKRPGRRMTQL